MPAPTVTSAAANVIGPPNADGSFWVRNVFTISNGTTVTIDRPRVPKGTDYAGADLTAQTAAMNTSLAVVPTPVTLAQAHQAVINAGLQTAVDTAVAAAPTSIQQLWYASPTIDRNDPNLNALGIQLGLTSEQLDDLFRAAVFL